MTNRKTTTIVWAIVALIGTLLESFDINLTGEQLGTLTNAGVIVVGLTGCETTGGWGDTQRRNT